MIFEIFLNTKISIETNVLRLKFYHGKAFCACTSTFRIPTSYRLPAFNNS